jgi:hypothetical protein
MPPEVSRISCQGGFGLPMRARLPIVGGEWREDE